MPESNYRITINAPIARVWAFVNNLRNWATLMPGYQDFKELDYDNSVWKLKGDVGIVQRMITLKAQVTERVEPSRVCFTLEGVDENVRGGGIFLATPTGDETEVEIQLTMKAGGVAGPMINALLSPMLNSSLAALAKGIKEKVEQS